MNKLDFLRKLDRALSVLDKEERREILAFYEERFYNGTIYENKTEEEVIAELERPEIIARNVLEEYGVSPKFVKTKEERYTNVSTTKAVLLIAFDVLIATSVLPALYSAVVAIFGSSLTWFTTIGLMLGERTTVDEFVFAFATGAFILLFLFGLVVLEGALWFTRTLVKWHLNVFKMKNRGNLIKKLSHWSLDSWFKKHRKAKRLKNLLLVGALITVAYTGSWIFRHYDWVEAEYANDSAINETITESFTAELASGDIWQINTDLENIAVQMIQGTSDDVVIKHSYFEDDDFEYEFNFETNVLTISNDTDPGINFFWNPAELFNVINQNNVVVIELPNGLELDDVELKTSNSTIYARNIDFENVSLLTTNGTIEVLNVTVLEDATFRTSNAKVEVQNSEFNGVLDIDSSNGQIEVRDVFVEEELNIKTSNATVRVIDVEGSLDSDLIVESSNGAITLRTNGFRNYGVETSNASVNLEELNSASAPAANVSVTTSNGKLTAENVYADQVYLSTTNADIEFYNEDTSFHPTVLDLDTSSYQDIDTNVTAE